MVCEEERGLRNGNILNLGGIHRLVGRVDGGLGLLHAEESQLCRGDGVDKLGAQRNRTARAH